MEKNICVTSFSKHSNLFLNRKWTQWEKWAFHWGKKPSQSSPFLLQALEKKNQKSLLNPSLHLETWNTEDFLPPWWSSKDLIIYNEDACLSHSFLQLVQNTDPAQLCSQQALEFLLSLSPQVSVFHRSYLWVLGRWPQVYILGQAFPLTPHPVLQFVLSLRWGSSLLFCFQHFW